MVKNHRKKTSPTTSPITTTPPRMTVVTAAVANYSGGSTVKPNPLHNFSPLPNIKWAAAALGSNGFKNLTINEPRHQPEAYRKIMESDKNPSAKDKQTCLATTGSNSKDPFVFKADNMLIGAEKLAIIADEAVADMEDNELPPKKRLAVKAVREAAKVVDFENGKNKEEPEEVDVDNLPLKTWNRRPRKKVGENTRRSQRGFFADNENSNSKKSMDGGDVKEEKKSVDDKKKGKKKVEEVKLPKFKFTLTKEEIEEDIFQMTGKLPSKKPTKRNKNQQQELDMLTPGMGLDSIKHGRYKVDPPRQSKKK